MRNLKQDYGTYRAFNKTHRCAYILHPMPAKSLQDQMPLVKLATGAWPKFRKAKRLKTRKGVVSCAGILKIVRHFAETGILLVRKKIQQMKFN